MRIVSILILIVFLLPSHGFALSKRSVTDLTTAEGTVLRGLIWGIKPFDVERFETGIFSNKEENNLFYADKIYNRESSIGYQFVENKLNRARIDIFGRTSNPQDWVDLLMQAQLDLEKRWGAPATENFMWDDEREKNFPDNWGLAVLTGDLKAEVLWAGPRTKVVLKLAANTPMRPVLSVVYEKRERPVSAALKNEGAPTEPSAPIIAGDDLLLLP